MEVLQLQPGLGPHEGVHFVATFIELKTCLILNVRNYIEKRKKIIKQKIFNKNEVVNVALLSKILELNKNKFSEKKFVTYNSCENKSFLNIFSSLFLYFII
jgi:hypothetical protein